MPLAIAYHRPDTLSEALELLGDPNRVPLAGGTVLNADRTPSQLEVVDLQALNLHGISTEDAPGGPTGARLRIGATTTLDALCRSELLPESLRERARAEQPSTMRTLATTGGVVAGASPESALLAALLAHDTHVESRGAASGASNDAETTPLAEFMAAAAGQPGWPGRLITAITVDPGGQAAFAATGRTPADTPIVSAYGRQTGGGPTVALTGVADHPVLVNLADPTAGLAPTGDFRGSAAYRLELAAVLTARVMAQLEGESR